MYRITRNQITYLLALVAGAILPIAFAPFQWYWIAMVSPAILLGIWLKQNARQAFWSGFYFGLGFFGIGVSWVYISIHRYGNASAPLAAFITTVFVIILALFPAIQGYLLQKICRLPRGFLLGFPSSWVLLEWIRSWLFTGFPWLILGDSQTNSPLRGFAPIVGQFGVSWIVVFCSALLIAFFHKKARYRVLYLLLLIAIVVSGYFLTPIQWTHPDKNPVKITLVQGNVPQEKKWDPHYIDDILFLYQKLALENLQSSLVILPEGSIPLTMTQAQEYLDGLAEHAKQNKASLIAGIFSQIDNSFSYYNSMIIIGNEQGIYHKRHLVPFGEFVPFPSFMRRLLGLFSIPMSDVKSGPWNQAPLKAANLKIAPFLCYEIAYSDVLLNALPEVSILLTITDDAWFGDSFAPWQHLQIAEQRAQETGRYLLLDSNDGITAIVTPKGTVQAILPQFKEAVLTGDVYGMQGSTPWVRTGMKPLIIFLFLTIIIAGAVSRLRND
jgi:apolipoprotein N-acyltransferase